MTFVKTKTMLNREYLTVVIARKINVVNWEQISVVICRKITDIKRKEAHQRLRGVTDDQAHDRTHGKCTGNVGSNPPGTHEGTR